MIVGGGGGGQGGIKAIYFLYNGPYLRKDWLSWESHTFLVLCKFVKMADKTLGLIIFCA